MTDGDGWSLSRLEWDSEFWGREVATARRARGAPALDAARLASSGFDFVYALCRSGDLSEVRDAEASGFRAVDLRCEVVLRDHLWQVSTVQRAPAPGLPILTPEDEARLDRIVTGYIVLMARTEPELDAGVASLGAAGYGIELSDEEELTYDDSTVHTRVVRVVSAPA